MAVEKVSQINSSKPIEKKAYIAPEAQDIQIDFFKASTANNTVNKMSLQCGSDGNLAKNMALQCGSDGNLAKNMALQCGSDGNLA